MSYILILQTFLKELYLKIFWETELAFLLPPGVSSKISEIRAPPLSIPPPAFKKMYFPLGIIFSGGKHTILIMIVMAVYIMYQLTISKQATAQSRHTINIYPLSDIGLESQIFMQSLTYTKIVHHFLSEMFSEPS